MTSESDLWIMANALCKLKAEKANFTSRDFSHLAAGVYPEKCMRFLTVIRMSGKFGLIRLGSVPAPRAVPVSRRVLVYYGFKEDTDDYTPEDIIKWWQRS